MSLSEECLLVHAAVLISIKIVRSSSVPRVFETVRVARRWGEGGEEAVHSNFRRPLSGVSAERPLGM